jgi:uncharacterized HAD superfamily protein
MLTFCYDLDGVICEDPTCDPGTPDYLIFLATAKLIQKPKDGNSEIITGRTENYREQTESWLRSNEIEYKNLIMKPVCLTGVKHTPKFKADHYIKSKADLFIESCSDQAEKIAELSGKPVYCTETKRLYPISI